MYRQQFRESRDLYFVNPLLLLLLCRRKRFILFSYCQIFAHLCIPVHTWPGVGYSIIHIHIANNFWHISPRVVFFTQGRQTQGEVESHIFCKWPQVYVHEFIHMSDTEPILLLNLSRKYGYYCWLIMPNKPWQIFLMVLCKGMFQNGHQVQFCLCYG